MRALRTGGLRYLTIILAVALAVSGCTAPGVPPGGPPPKVTSVTSPSPTPRLVTPIPSPTPTASPTPRPRPIRVLLISLDGLRPDALDPARTPNLLALAASGAASYTAQTVLPSATLPAHGSMLSGYDVEDHGLTWNDYIPDRGSIRTETLFSVAHAAGMRTEMVVSKQKLVHIATPGTVDSFIYVAGGDFAVADQATQSIADGFEVLFVHFPGPDAAGHSGGWMSQLYLGTVANTDEAVGRVLQALDSAGLRDGTLILVTADHGGHGTLHGGSSPEDMTIPWIISGPGVAAGTELISPVTVTDTTATALWALGLPLPEDLDGVPVWEAFGLASPQAAAVPAPKVTFPASWLRDRVVAPSGLRFQG